MCAKNHYWIQPFYASRHTHKPIKVCAESLEAAYKSIQGVFNSSPLDMFPVRMTPCDKPNEH